MKKTYRATTLIRATAKGLSVWIPDEAIVTAKAMPEEETESPPSKEGGA